MRAVVQRVAEASVSVGGETLGKIKQGLCALVGVGRGDDGGDAGWLTEKIVGLRVFDDAEGRMNLDIRQAGGSLLIVSQFTLYGDCRKGRRPSYDAAMPPDEARFLYEMFTRMCADTGVPVETGVFRAEMAVSIVNDGPVTLLLDSKKAF